LNLPDQSILDRILALINNLRINRRKFAMSVQYSESYLSHILSNRKAVTRKFARNVRDLHNVNLHWFYIGEGEMLGNSVFPRHADEDVNYWTADTKPFPVEMPNGLLPVFELPPDGKLADSWPEPMPKTIDRFNIEHNASASQQITGSTHAFRMRSYEMFPRLAPGDLVLCNHLESFESIVPSRRRVYVLHYNDQIVCRYITDFSEDKTSVELVSEDENLMPSVWIPVKDIKNLWIARHILLEHQVQA